MAEIIWTEPALSDLDAIADYAIEQKVLSTNYSVSTAPSARAISAPGNSSGIIDRIRSRFFNVCRSGLKAYSNDIARLVKNRKKSRAVSTEVTVQSQRNFRFQSTRLC